jgi:TonB family protein
VSPIIERVLAAIAALVMVLSVRAAGEDETYRRHVVNAPEPLYPLEARAKHWTGHGVVLVDVDSKTGYVVGARMLKSTGHTILDHAAIGTFSRWRFKPGTVKQVKIPINYVM